MSSRGFPALLALSLIPAPAAAQTTLNPGGNALAAAGWSNGFPSPGNDGTIATNGTFNGAVNFNQGGGAVTVSHTSGTLTGGTANFFNGPTSTATGFATYNWNQSGGTVTLNQLSPNLRVTYTLSGTGSLTTTAPLSALINPFNTGVFNQTGGTTNGFGYSLDDGNVAAKTHTLSGGTGTAVRLLTVGTLNTAIVDGSFSLTFNSNVATISIGTTGAGVIDFQHSWSGSWTRDNFTLANWQAVVTKSGMRYEGVQITTENFSTFFEVANAGAAGSSLRLSPTAPVPEPAAYLGIAAAGLTLAGIARRQRTHSSRPAR